jgi:Mrp family chromosome partitioning ATPase
MDLRHPSLQKMYQVPDRFGLARYLTGEAKDLRDVVQKTVVANLDLLPCGATDSDPSDLIASERLKSLLVAARASYNRIIMDCPAMSAVGESLTLSAMADCTVFLIPVNRVRRRFALRFVRKLQAGGINVTGVVLNDVD